MQVLASKTTPRRGAVIRHKQVISLVGGRSGLSAVVVDLRVSSSSSRGVVGSVVAALCVNVVRSVVSSACVTAVTEFVD